MLSGHYHKRLKRLWGSTEERISSLISSALLHLKGRPWLVISLGSSWLQHTQPEDLEAEWSRAGMGCLGCSEGSLAASFPVFWWQSSKKVFSDVLGRQQAPGVPWKHGNYLQRTVFIMEIVTTNKRRRCRSIIFVYRCRLLFQYKKLYTGLENSVQVLLRFLNSSVWVQVWLPGFIAKGNLCGKV